MKKKIPFIVFFIATSFVIWTLEPKDVKIVEVKKEKKPSRSIASIPPSKNLVTKATKKVVIKKEEIVKTTKLHEENKKIESKLINYYNNIFDNNVKISLSYEKEVEVNEDKSSYKAKVYKVSFDKGQGNKSNFKALIDSKTGMILKTWNHTRFEFKEAVRLSGEGHEFYSL